jgi:hypothetical protein
MNPSTELKKRHQRHHKMLRLQIVHRVLWDNSFSLEADMTTSDAFFVVNFLSIHYKTRDIRHKIFVIQHNEGLNDTISL